MGDTGLEQSLLTHSRTSILESGGTKFDTHCTREAPKEPDLAIVVNAWPELPVHIEAAIKALIQTI